MPTVALLTPRTGAATRKLSLPGTVQAWYEAPIYARVSGYLKQWYFDYGAHVKKGDLLAEIEAPDLDAQLAASQAKLNSAKAQVKVREAERAVRRIDLRTLARIAQGRRFRAGTGIQAGRLQQRRRPAQRRRRPKSPPIRARSTASQALARLQEESSRRSTAS